jgi:2-desacetyl-2-hydroxyethyl bacteriochlorophyllide A dehydrogenase
MSTHRSALWTEQGIGVREASRPVAGPGELLIAVRACGICGSDLHVFRGETPRPAGVGPGHEVVGEIVALGEGVAGPTVGTRVAVEPYTSCGSCRHCLRGRGYLCPRRRLLGFGLPGGMAEHVVVPAGRVYPLPAELEWTTAALTEPAAIVLHGLRRAGLEVGQRVFVIGAGTIGLLATLLARAGGATRVGVAARHPQQRRMALALGADEVVAPEEAMAGSPLARGGWDLVVETVGGHAPTLQQALDLADAGGTVLLLGVHSVPQEIVTRRIWLDEVTVVGAFGYGRWGGRADYEDAVALLARHRAELAPLVTHTFPLERAADAFAAAADKRSGAIKVVVTP